MRKTKSSEEQILAALKLGESTPADEVCRSIGGSRNPRWTGEIRDLPVHRGNTHFAWKKKYLGGLHVMLKRRVGP